MAWPIDYVDIGDLVTLPAHYRRQKAMQPIEIRQHQENLAPERLQAAAGVAGTVVQNAAAYAVGDLRLDLLESGVLAAHARAASQTAALAAALDRRDQIRQECRIVLAVAVKRRHDGATRGADPAAHR